MAGMHAQMMPTLISIVDHRCVSKLSKVGLSELEKVTRACSLRTLTTVTLIEGWEG